MLATSNEKIADLSQNNDTSAEWLSTSQPRLPKTSSPLITRDSSPNRIDRNNDVNSAKYGDISPIKATSDLVAHKLISTSNSLTLNMSPTDIGLELKRLVEQVNDQKTVVLECLENDCDKEELNGHMAVRIFFYASNLHSYWASTSLFV